MTGQVVWQVHCLVGAPLGRKHYAPDILHLGVVSRGDTVQAARNPSPQVGYHHKQDVLWQNASVPSFLDVSED